MWPAEEPLFKASDMALECVKGIRNASLRTAVRAGVNLIAENNKAYQAFGSENRLHAIEHAVKEIPGVSAADLKWLYTNKVAKVGARGRTYYDTIIASAPYGRCVYCCHNTATTLDHFAPQAIVSTLTIDPHNLVPSCKDCNHSLSDYWSHNPSAQLLHPYFLPKVGRWLFATIGQAPIPIVRFHIRPENDLPAIQKERMEEQFNRLKLSTLYGKLAAKEVSRLVRQLPTRLTTEGARRAHLSESAETLLEDDPNDWRGVMYEGLAADRWFCQNGFLS